MNTTVMFLVLSCFFCQAQAIEFASVGQIGPTPPWNPMAEPLENIDLQATEDIAGDSIMVALGAGDPAFAVGGRIVLTLTGGATFADVAYSLEQWAGGAGTGNLNFAVFQVPVPNPGSTQIEFILQDDGLNPIAAEDSFILSGAVIAGQASNFNLPVIPGVDISLEVEVFDNLNASNGNAQTIIFESNLAPVSRPIPTISFWGLAALSLVLVGFARYRLREDS
ncbi:MAG: hypothetical protein ABW100_12265 [Candidatus Thiodiazotropha sp. 6PLUC3]